MADRHSEPRCGVFASPLEMDKRRKNRKKRVGRAILRSHPSTHPSRDRSLATCAKRPLVVRSAALEKVEIITTGVVGKSLTMCESLRGMTTKSPADNCTGLATPLTSIQHFP